MLNRRILRIKVFKALYAGVQTWDSSSPANLADVTAQFHCATEATRDLYLFMLGLVSPLTALAQERQEAAKKKANPTQEDLYPNTKFIENSLAKYLSENEDFQKAFGKRKFSWEQYDLVLKKILNNVVSKDYYQAYMATQERSLNEDCALFTKIFEEELVDLPELSDLLEEMSIWWNDDLAYSLTWCCRTFADIAAQKEWEMPCLYQSDMMKGGPKLVEDDQKFALKLLEFAFCNYAEYSDRVAQLTGGWEKDRLVTTDVALIVCALSECVYFENIPLRVSMNEYVEISKFYGTPKSSVFVNGLLDRLVKGMKEEGIINKN